MRIIILMLLLSFTVVSTGYAVENSNIRTGFFGGIGIGGGLVGDMKSKSSGSEDSSEYTIESSDADASFIPEISFGYEWNSLGLSLVLDNAKYTYEMKEDNYSTKVTLKATDVLVNLYYKFNLNSPVTPYVSVGAGYSMSDLEFNYGGGYISSGDVSGILVAANIGASYNINNNIAVSLDYGIKLQPSDSKYTMENTLVNIENTIVNPIIQKVMLKGKYYIN